MGYLFWLQKFVSRTRDPDLDGDLDDLEIVVAVQSVPSQLEHNRATR